MAQAKKPPKRSKRDPSPKPTSPEELEAILAQIASDLMNARTVEDRRELVMKLDARGLSRRQIHNRIGAYFKVKLATIDADLKWARDYYLNWARKQSREEAAADVEKVNREVIRQGFEQGDLHAVNTANRLKASIHQLIKEGFEGNGKSLDEETLRAEIETKLAAITRKPNG